VLELLSKGLSSKEIVGKLFISYSSVSKERQKMLDITGAANSPQLVAMYLEGYIRIKIE
jgi:DNA-binding CsgD family transcriptional regulator